MWSAKAELSLFLAEAPASAAVIRAAQHIGVFCHEGAEAAASAEEGRKLRLCSPHQ